MEYKQHICKNECCKLISWTVENPKEKKFSSKIKAGVILNNTNNKLLIIQSRNFKWGFPKGGIEKDESIVKCASRELREETTISIPISTLELKPYIKLKGITLYIVKNYIPPKIKISEIQSLPNNDVSGIGWVSPECFKNTNLPITRHLYDYLTK